MAAHLMDFLGRKNSRQDPAALLNLGPPLNVGSCIPASHNTLGTGTGLEDAFQQPWAVVTCHDPACISAAKELMSSYLPCK